MQVRIFNNERITIQTKAMVSLYQNMKLHFTLVFKLLTSNCISFQNVINTAKVHKNRDEMFKITN